jgi:hypothetical protein
MEDKVAKNTGAGFRLGAVKSRSQSQNPRAKFWSLRDTGTGRFLNNKSNGKPFKGVRKER